MSSFVANNTHMCALFSGLKILFSSETDRIAILGYNNKDVLKIKYNKNYYIKTDRGIQKLLQELHDINVRSVNVQYQDNEPYSEIKFKLVHPLSRIALYKALRCVRYQICPERLGVPDIEFIKVVDDIIYCLGINILIKLPEYTKADWEIPEDKYSDMGTMIALF
jgi:hypothetical protein